MRVVRISLFALLTVTASAAVVRECERTDGKYGLPGKPLRTDMLADASIWMPVDNYANRLSFDRTGGTLAVVHRATAGSGDDTAWGLCTKPLPLSVKGLGYAVAFSVATTNEIQETRGGEKYNFAVSWYEASGMRIERDVFSLHTPGGGTAHKVFIGSIPLAAEAFTLQLGFDEPDLDPGQRLDFSDLSFSVLANEMDPAWTPIPVKDDPRIKIVSKTPFADPLAELSFSISCARKIDLEKVSVRIDGKDATGCFVRRDNVFSLRPAETWSAGIHRVDITYVDPDSQKAQTSEKAVLCGTCPQTPTIRLRTDGTVLRDGTPVFPIGIYDVRKREFNGFSYDTAMMGLKAAGVNLVHNYAEPNGEEFLSAADRHGMMALVSSWNVSADLVDRVRHHPCLLAWYVGDDTSLHCKPFQIFDRSDRVNAVDGTRITAQADAMGACNAVSAYRPFVETTDVFMPEIYPVRFETPVPQPDCVAQAICAMKRFRSDVAEAKDVRPHAVWPVIQYFQGWTVWKRFPTADELFAMSFATLVHGANGIVWYTYGGFHEPERNRTNRGVTASPEIWANFTNLTSRIALLAPALVEPTPADQPPPARIIKGPKADALQNPSISLLLKRHRGAAYLLAVNSSCEKVIAEIAPPGVGVSAEVLWEGRRAVLAEGVLIETFAPLAVHVYRFSLLEERGGGPLSSSRDMKFKREL